MQLVQETLQRWQRDNAIQLGAAIAFYAALSLAPLLIFAVGIAGAVFGEQAARGEIVTRISTIVGPEAASLIQQALQQASQPGSGVIATLIGVGVLAFGATNIFWQIKQALNAIWGVRTVSEGVQGLTQMLLGRLVSFVMVLGFGALLLLSLVLNTAVGVAVNAVRGFVGELSPELARLSELLPVIQIGRFVVVILLIAAAIAAVYKFLPDVEIRWRDVLVGAGVTAVLLGIGNILLGVYFSRSSIGSAYGAAGSLLALLTWIYYSANMFFVGAEFTQVYANRYGGEVRPAKNAVRVLKRERTTRQDINMDAMNNSLLRQDQLNELNARRRDQPTPAPKEPDRLSSAVKGGIVAAVIAVIGGLIGRFSVRRDDDSSV